MVDAAVPPGALSTPKTQPVAAGTVRLPVVTDPVVVVPDPENSLAWQSSRSYTTACRRTSLLAATSVTDVSDPVATFEKTSFSHRTYCKRCGGHLLNGHPSVGLVDVFSATIPTLEFAPGVHVNYAETVLPIKDGLPKMKDFPAELGGSGVTLPE